MNIESSGCFVYWYIKNEMYHYSKSLYNTRTILYLCNWSIKYNFSIEMSSGYKMIWSSWINNMHLRFSFHYIIFIIVLSIVWTILTTINIIWVFLYSHPNNRTGNCIKLLIFKFKIQINLSRRGLLSFSTHGRRVHGECSNLFI